MILSTYILLLPPMARKLSLPCFTPLFFFACFAQLLPAPSWAADTPAPSSFIDYTPTEAQFAPPLHGIVQAIAEGRKRNQTKQKVEARALFEKALQEGQSLLSSLTRGHADEIYFLMGLAYEGLEQDALAIAAYKQALLLGPGDPIALMREAALFRKAGQCEAAIPLLREASWRNPAGRLESDYLLVECLLDLGQKEQAYLVAERAGSSDNRFAPLLRQLVAIRAEKLESETDPRVRTKLEGQMLADLRRIVESDPSDRQSALKLGRLLLRKSDPLMDTEQLAQCEELSARLAEASNYSDPEAVKLLFDVQLKRGEMEAAQSTLERGLESQPEHALLLEAKKQMAIESGISQSSAGSED